MIRDPFNARQVVTRRAFSLLELLAVLAILGVVGSAAYLRFGSDTLATTSAEGFVRTLTLDLRQARDRTISTGDDHYLLMQRTAGVITSYSLMRDTGGGVVQVDRQVKVPRGVTVTTLSDEWRFAFDGSLNGGAGAGMISVIGPHSSWTLIAYLATGSVRMVRTP